MAKQHQATIGWMVAASIIASNGLAVFCAACGGGSDGVPWTPGTTGGGGASSSSGGTASSGSSSGGASSSSGGTASSGSSGAGSSGASGDGGSSLELGMTVDQPTVKSQLLANTTVKVSVAPNGYAGPATLALASMPAGVTGKFDHDTIALDGNTTYWATLTLATADSAPPGSTTIEVDADIPTHSGQPAGKATIAFMVQSVITLHIPKGVSSMGAITTAYGPNPIKITAPNGLSVQNPVTVYFMNDDSVSHTVHALYEAQGFGHDPAPIAPHSMDPYVRYVNTTGSYSFFLHEALQAVGVVDIN